MTQAPTRYYVEWSDGDAFAADQEANHGASDPRDFTHRQDYISLGAAKIFKAIKGINNYAAIYERTDIVDTTPGELRQRGITWYSADFESELIED